MLTAAAVPKYSIHIQPNNGSNSQIRIHIKI